jgi:hypothetical protein
MPFASMGIDIGKASFDGAIVILSGLPEIEVTWEGR